MGPVRLSMGHPGPLNSQKCKNNILWPIYAKLVVILFPCYTYDCLLCGEVLLPWLFVYLVVILFACYSYVCSVVRSYCPDVCSVVRSYCPDVCPVVRSYCPVVRFYCPECLFTWVQHRGPPGPPNMKKKSFSSYFGFRLEHFLSLPYWTCT